MKRIVYLISMVLCLMPLIGSDAAAGDKNDDSSYASSFFKIGVRGGIDFVSMSRFELGYISESVSSHTGFNAGLAFSFDLPVRGLTIQPELNYVSKGALFRGESDIHFKTGYIELPVNIQAGLDLILLRPYIMVSPYIGYAVYKQPGFLDWNSINRFEYGIGVGGGIDFWRLQLQVKYNWNIGSLVRNKDRGGDQAGETSGNMVPSDFLGSVREGNFRGLEVSIVFFF